MLYPLALGLFILGLVATIVIFGLSILGVSQPGPWLYLLAMCAPAGFVVGLIYALSSGRRTR